MVLFESVFGRVVQLADPVTPINVQLLGMLPSISFLNQASIVTRVMLSERSNVQFLHTLGNHVYIYTFGDKIGSVTLSGLAFTQACGIFQPGGELVYTWYKTFRVSRSPLPVRVALGLTVLEGFVTGFNEDTVDPSTGLQQWTVELATLPNDDVGGGAPAAFFSVPIGSA